MFVLILLLLISPGVLAATKVRAFRNPSCDSTELDSFSNHDSHADTTCHVPPRNITRALYIDELDRGCSIVTYSDYACNATRARRTFAEKDMCFFSRNGGILRSWRIVCNKEADSVLQSWESIRATQVKSSKTVSTTVTASSYILTMATSISSWITWDGTVNVTRSATVTRTGSVLVTSTSFRGEGVVHPTGLGVNAALVAMMAVGGFVAAL